MFASFLKASLVGSLLWCFPALANAQIYQWTDARGVIHFTDNLDRVPEPVRRARELTVLTEQDLKGGVILTDAPPPPRIEEPVYEPPPPRVVRPPEPAPVVLYNPQFITIVVNSVVRRPRKTVPVFRPSFDDRQFIHPSVFDGGSRQFIRPELFR